MNLSKSFEFFDPNTCKKRIHMIGCGSVGSTVVELLARFGLEKFALYDFDHVEPHNIINQMFTQKDVGKEKVEAVKEMILAINPDANIKVYPAGWQGEDLDGYVFLGLDNIELRKQIATASRFNEAVEAMFDFRTGLTDAQHFAADWKDVKAKKSFIDSMNFTHEQAQQETRMSACNIAMCVAPTVRMIANVGVTNFINFLKGEHLYKIITLDAFNFERGIEAVG